MEEMMKEGRRLTQEVGEQREEIERLRASNDAMLKEGRRLEQVVEEQRGELDRLRASNYALAVHLQRAQAGASERPWSGGGADGEAF